MADVITVTFFSILAAGFLVGVVVGLTGMGGGALMTPALIFLGVGDAATVVTADLTAAAVYKTGGAVVHAREGSPNLTLAKWLILGSVPMALLGPYLVDWFTEPGRDRRRAQDVHRLRAAVRGGDVRAAPLHQPAPGPRRRPPRATRTRTIRPLPTLLVGALGGLLVGITSVGSGSVIMIALLMLYPGLSAVKLVGTDLVQAVPLVLAAAISNIALHGLDLALTIPLILGSVPGTILGSQIAPRVPQSFIRRGIVVVLTMSGVALLDKAGWAPLGAGSDVRAEAVVVPQSLQHRLEHCGVNGDHPVTIPADQVEVLVVADRVVRRGAVAEVCVPDQAELLEHLEGAVDGRDVDRTGLLADLGEHLVGGGVAEPVDGAQDQLALRGQALAAAPEPLGEVTHRPRPLTAAAAGPTGAAAAPGPSRPCRRRRAGPPRRTRRAACPRSSPWRCRCGRPRR